MGHERQCTYIIVAAGDVLILCYSILQVPGQPETEDFTWFYVILGGMAAYSAIVIILFKKYHWF
jgi:hypothetical protein